ncbi:AraC family transcriptional regulator [Porticoccaceae bacterium]|jgi:AraC-like DNA-binding protein|nr:AraC family transcriptional regulator [Porticoccaceae bacterium]MDC0003258.1 AraC family transcriptional regulator [Porticoccaceae bacterium]
MHGLRERQHPQQQALERAGINPTVIENSGQRVHTEQVARLFKTVQETLDDEFMGFTQNNCKVGLFATMAELVSHCSTLGELLEKAVNFYNLVSNDIPMRLSRSRGNAVLSFTMAKPEFDPEHFMAEFWLVIWHRFPSWYIGEPIRLKETHFTFSAPQHRGELEIMFPADLQFNSSANRLIFDAQYLDKPLVRSAQELETFVQNAPADVMTIPGSDTTLEAQIERIIGQRHPDRLVFVPMHQLAKELGISSQTLHRRLKESATSYQKIKDNLRREVAIQKLVHEKLSVEEVADIVGFTESRSFTRAFKHWTGLTPRQHCKQKYGTKLAEMAPLTYK